MTKQFYNFACRRRQVWCGRVWGGKGTQVVISTGLGSLSYPRESSYRYGYSTNLRVISARRDCFIRAKLVFNWYQVHPKKQVCACARVPRAHTCVRLIILVLVRGIMYHIRTYLVSARYQPATKIRICSYVCARVGYVLCATYVRKLVWARLFVPGISRLPRYVYVDTYVPVAEITWK